VAPVPLRVTDDPAHMVDDGEAVNPTVGDGFTVTPRVCSEELPHPLMAVTLNVPLAPEELMIIILVVDAPDHPAGKDHI